VLIGQRLTSESIEAAADAAAGPARPLDNTDLSHAWRKRMVRSVVQQALERAAAR
jgi:CO/xanthine dehydrogenase FAD-binding subunit